MKRSACFSRIIRLSILAVVWIQSSLAQHPGFRTDQINKFLQIESLHSDSMQVEAGWNLLSLPVKVTDGLKNSLFPTAVSDAFIYCNNYQPKDTLENGEGFWLKYDSAETIFVFGEPLHHDTIIVQAGWNMVGSLSEPVILNTISTDPPGIILSNFYYYSHDTYQTTDTLRPGMGYWLKLKNNGSIILFTLFVPPKLESPPDRSVNIPDSLILTWHSCVSAISYALQVSSDSTFSDLVYNQSGITDTMKEITGLSNLKKYYWRVNSTNGLGTTEWSDIWTFKTEAGPCPGIPTVLYEGEKYSTVQIYSQCWMKENLDVGIMVLGGSFQEDNDTLEKYCFENRQTNCDIYGGLYQWREAMQYSTSPGVRGICPTGWHIPTLGEYEILASAFNNEGNALKAVGQGVGAGAGTNESGFSALFGGYRQLDEPMFVFWFMGSIAFIWTSTEYNSLYAYSLILLDNDNSILPWDYAPWSVGFSVRCLKD